MKQQQKIGWGRSAHHPLTKKWPVRPQVVSFKGAMAKVAKNRSKLIIFDASGGRLLDNLWLIRGPKSRQAGTKICTVLYSTVLYSTVQYCTVLCSTVQYCAVQYCAVLCCTVLYSIVQYLTLQIASRPLPGRFQDSLFRHPRVFAKNVSGIEPFAPPLSF